MSEHILASVKASVKANKDPLSLYLGSNVAAIVADGGITNVLLMFDLKRRKSVTQFCIKKFQCSHFLLRGHTLSLTLYTLTDFFFNFSFYENVLE